MMKSTYEFTVDVILTKDKNQVYKKNGIEFTLISWSRNWLDNQPIYFRVNFCEDDDFEITNVITAKREFSYDNGFKCPPDFELPCNATFHILKHIKYRKAPCNPNFVTIEYPLKIPIYRFDALKVEQFSEHCFTLPGYDFLTFKYFIKKAAENYIEIHIENVHRVEICGKQADFKFIVTKQEDITRSLSFAFNPTAFQESIHNPTFEESRPVSTLPLLPPPTNLVTEESALSLTITKPNMYEIMANSRYFDVILLSSDKVEIKSHRCILDKFSNILKDLIIKSDELPVKINIDQFNAEIIQAALDFLYDKTDSILGKEIEVFKFAKAFDIEFLKEVCCCYFEENVYHGNVCEFVQIAYENGFEKLKQKCKQFIATNKAAIDPSKLKSLPKEIIVDIFCA